MNAGDLEGVRRRRQVWQLSHSFYANNKQALIFILFISVRINLSDSQCEFDGWQILLYFTDAAHEDKFDTELYFLAQAPD